jgi:protein-disulfide isomerase
MVVGLAMGWYLFTDNSEPTATIDADIIRAIVQEAISDSGFTPSITENRFEFVDDDPYIGAEDAPIVIVEFGDFRCSYCGRHHEQTFQPILENYGQYIRYVFRDFPGLGQESYNAAVAAQCANDQDKFWEFHEELFANQGEIGRNLYFNLAVRYGLDLAQFTECYESAEYLKEINLDYYDGQTNNVQGTPSFFVNGTFIRGAQSYDVFEREILRELDKAGITLDTQSLPETSPPTEEEVGEQST